jgi:hypothetical protein
MNINTLMIAAILLSFSSAVIAQVKDLQKTYAENPSECRTPAKQILISQGKIEGPSFSCAIENERLAGTGLWVYDASCMINGKSIDGEIPMGISMDSKYFSISLPDSDDWMDIHACKKSTYN